jgi:carbon storage regulator
MEGTAMLVLTRRVGEEIVIGKDIRVVVVAGTGNAVKLGVVAPRSVRVDRAEVAEWRVKYPAGRTTRPV